MSMQPIDDSIVFQSDDERDAWDRAYLECVRMVPEILAQKFNISPASIADGFIRNRRAREPSST